MKSRPARKASGKPPKPKPSRAGWAALSEGRWDAATRAFAHALKEEETPGSFEGLSWAAWWLDDADTVFRAREQAFRLYRSHGDAAGAARMATWLAADHLDFRGAFAVANGWFRRARRLLATLEPGPDHGWLDFHEGYVAFSQGDTVRSSMLARRAFRLGRRFETPDLEMLGLALEGAVLVACAKVREGMRRLDEATTVALETGATIPISRAWACCFLVTACEAVRDYRRAFEWCDRIAEFVERYGSHYMLGFCRHHYATIHVWRGRWQDAEAQFRAAVDAYSRSRPAYVGGALAGLAELRRRQGRWDEVEQLLGRADALVCRSWLALDRGDPQQAMELAARALRQTPKQTIMNRAPALEALVAAAAQHGDVQQANAALTALKKVARRADTVSMRAAVHLAEGTIAVAAGDCERARPLLEDAVDEFERSGAPFEAAQARLVLARGLIALGRSAEGAREAQISLTRFTGLGAEAAARRARTLLDMPAAVSRPPAPVPEVTRRERDVLRCLAEGLTNRQIASRLFVSEHTVHRHITSILRKLGLPTRTAAATHAVRAGLLDSPAG